jgi:hypothetical protein
LRPLHQQLLRPLHQQLLRLLLQTKDKILDIYGLPNFSVALFFSAYTIYFSGF